MKDSHGGTDRGSSSRMFSGATYGQHYLAKMASREKQREIPPVEEYENWIESLPARSSRKKLNPARIRRMVMLVRDGDSINEASRKTGVSKHTYKALPENMK